MCKVDLNDKMLRNSIYTFCVFLLCFGLVLSENPSNHTNETTPPKTEISSTTEYVSSSTQVVTEKPITTEPKPEPKTDPKPITVEPKPDPTTHPTETTKPSPTSTTTKTTPSVSTSTVAPLGPTTTPIPVNPEPSAQKGHWNVTVNNVTCIIFEGIIEIDVTFKNKTSKTEQVKKVYVPKYANATGECKKENEITLSWNNNTVRFIFLKNDSTKNYALSGIVGHLHNISNLNSTDFNTNSHLNIFETPLNQSYLCSAIKQIKVNNNTKVQLDEFHIQAFKTTNNKEFDQSLDCVGEHTPDIVPIIVGCVLAVLVASVLVAYLISRRRSQTRGYLSM